MAGPKHGPCRMMISSGSRICVFQHVGAPTAAGHPGAAFASDEAAVQLVGSQRRLYHAQRKACDLEPTASWFSHCMHCHETSARAALVPDAEIPHFAEAK